MQPGSLRLTADAVNGAPPNISTAATPTTMSNFLITHLSLRK
jgi:hypothetical protein